jgi:hypothetical protein
MKTRINGKNRELGFGRFVAAAYGAGAGAGRKGLCGWLSTHAEWSFEGDSALRCRSAQR